METVLRYARNADLDTPSVDGFDNYHFTTAADDGTRASLESGINAMRVVQAVDGPRRPAILLRSSPWKAGQESNPWHDILDLDHGYARYYGDHKPRTPVPVGSSRGNAWLTEAFEDHRGASEEARLRAAPLMLFQSVTVRGIVKGHVKFCGLAIIEFLEHVVQRETGSGHSFPNLVYDLALLDLSRDNEFVDWRWIDDRRNSQLTKAETLRYAPVSWREWVRYGAPRMPRLRRRVVSSRVRSAASQIPAPNTQDRAVLETLYARFDGRKHAFELLASRVAGHVLGGRGATYHEGWTTRGSGDGGADFVGRLDVGDGQCVVPIVVLGQAKCVGPGSSISAERLARVVARLRRGWIGVYVTTGLISRAAQLEMVDDQYPILLISGLDLAVYTQRLAHEGHAGNLDAFLDEIITAYPSSISARRPEEVLEQ